MNHSTATTPDSPLQQATSWLQTVGFDCVRSEPLAGDVSSRSYARIWDRAQRSAILAHYPGDLRRSYSCFERTDELLTRAGVDVPRILHHDPDRRFMVTEDVGRHTLFETDPAQARLGLTRAVEAIERIGQLAVSEVAELSPALEVELLTREVRSSFANFFDGQLSKSARAELGATLFGVCERLGGGPLRPAHRDFMARNLMLASMGESARLVVLDHQDLRLAPEGYDLASLFFDSWPLDASAREPLLAAAAPSERLREAIARCAVQRCVKIVGTFHAFAARGNSRYLAMVPGALRVAARALSSLPEAHGGAGEHLLFCAEASAARASR